MARGDLLKIGELLNSHDDGYFEKGVRAIKDVLPSAIRTHDRETAEALTEELIGTFWYWDRRVPQVRDWKKVKHDLSEFVLIREKARGRRDTIRSLLLEIRDVAEKLRDRNSQHHGLAHHLLEVLDRCESDWNMAASERIADGEAAGKWSVRPG